MESTKVLLVDDHAILRELLGERLASKASIQVVGSVGNPDDAIDVALAKSPDVIVMDIDMPGRNVFDAARVISSRLPREVRSAAPPRARSRSCGAARPG